MIIVVDSSGVVTPVPDDVLAPELPSHRFQVDLVGADGSEWDLTRGDVVLTPGARLFAAPTVTHWWKSSPGVDGSRWDGMRTEQQSKIVPVVVLGEEWEEWRDRDAALFRAVHPARDCTLRVTSPDKQSRTIGLRFVAGGDVDVDPLADYFAAYALEFTAANPFWAGEPIVVTFPAAAPLPLFPGPPFPINRPSINGEARVTNPGDEPAWPRYRVVGPATSWTIGVGDAVVASSTALAAGQSVTVDMRPEKLTVVDQDGTNVYQTLTNDTFAPIPPGDDVRLSTSLTGSGATSAITVDFTPLYRRPW